MSFSAYCRSTLYPAASSWLLTLAPSWIHRCDELVGMVTPISSPLPLASAGAAAAELDADADELFTAGELDAAAAELGAAAAEVEAASDPRLVEQAARVNARAAPTAAAITRL